MTRFVREQQQNNMVEFEDCLKSNEAKFKVIPSRKRIIKDYKISHQYQMDELELMKSKISFFLQVLTGEILEVDPRFPLDWVESLRIFVESKFELIQPFEK